MDPTLIKRRFLVIKHEGRTRKGDFPRRSQLASLARLFQPPFAGVPVALESFEEVFAHLFVCKLAFRDVGG